MTKTNWKSLLAVIAAGTLAMSGCSGADGKDGANGTNGSDGATGPTGPAGQDLTESAKAESCEVCHPAGGAAHQAAYNAFADGIKPATTKFASTITGVAVTPGTNAGTFKATVTFTLKKSGAPFVDAASTLKQKTMYFVTYDAATGNFPTPAYVQGADVDPTGELGGSVAGQVENFSFGSMTLVDAATGTWTMVKDNLVADPIAAATNAFVYGYFGDVVLTGLEGNANPGGRHYALMDNMVSVARVLKGTIGYASSATVTGCERCHGAPYSKHGYRQATVAGLNDFVACKACHTDFRRGTDGGWYLVVDDPAAFAAQAGVLTPAQKSKYAYVANVMNDTHNSHAFEFEYPQSMANCSTCHAGKLNLVLTDANFQLVTCRSCHPVTGTGGTATGRAPALKTLIPAAAAAFHTMDLYTWTGDCSSCHKAGGAGKPLAEIHPGYDKVVHPTETTNHADSVTTTVDSATFDGATSKLTLNFSVTGANAAAIIKPTVVMSLYGYDTKDFIVSGHGSQPAPDSKRNLEWAEGATGNSPRLAVTPAVAVAANKQWVAVADLTLWAAKLADGSVKRMELGVLPSIGLDQTKAVDNAATVTTGGVTSANPNYNPAILVKGITRTFDLVGKALVADASSYGKAIVDPAKCNKCHDGLGTTFHNASYGSAGVVGCRLCHWGGSGGSHLEMQSRSIDSYIHAIHSMQAFDVSAVDFADPIQKLRYEEKNDAVYPNFSIKNCESCHYAGTYNVPDQGKSMPSILSGSGTPKNWDRNIGTVPSYVTGAGFRACGSCHRAQMIKEDDASLLVSFYEHSHSNGTLVANNTGVWDAAVAKIMALFK